MLRFKLDEIATASNLRATVFELLGAAEAKGWVPTGRAYRAERSGQEARGEANLPI